MPPSDRGRGFALGEKWTDRHPVHGERHFVVVRALADGTVELEAVLTRRRRIVSREALEQVEGWSRGW